MRCRRHLMFLSSSLIPPRGNPPPVGNRGLRRHFQQGRAIPIELNFVLFSVHAGTVDAIAEGKFRLSVSNRSNVHSVANITVRTYHYSKNVTRSRIIQIIA